MRLTRLEKILVNRRQEAERNIGRVRRDLEQIELARTRQPTSDRLRFAVEDATHLTFENASFDLVLSQDIFHHIPDWEQVVREVVRVL